MKINTASAKMFRFGQRGKERPGVELPDGTRLDISAFGEDYSPAFFHNDGLSRLVNWLKINAGNCPVVDADERIASCITGPGKIIAAGINYRTHADEAAYPVPVEPVLFLKATSSLSGPFDDIPVPVGSIKLDWECELAVVIGKAGRYIAEENAYNYIAGYTVVNDVSERTYQLEGTGQWTKGKSFDNFCPLGPYFVPKALVLDDRSLQLKLMVNGQVMQRALASEMIFNVAFLISYISRHMTLMPGDLLLTGTPGGVGLGQQPPVFLKAGDEVVNEITGLGQQRQKVVSFDEWAKVNPIFFK